MQERSEQMLERIHKFRKLHMQEKLNLIPKSEMVTMRTILEQCGQKKTRGCRISEIARKLEISPPAISRTIKRLREKQYVRCIVDETDRRNVRVVVTAAGEAALAADLQKVHAFMQRALAYLSPEEADQFFALFDKIYRGMWEELRRIPSGTEHAAGEGES